MALSLPQHLLKTSFDVVKRWVNEAQEAASSDNIMVQVGNPPPTQGIAAEPGVEQTTRAQPGTSVPQRG